jgi:hypothetical protein
MFGSFDEKVSIFDITVEDMKTNEEIRLRCSSNDREFFSTDPRCLSLCHYTCDGIKLNDSQRYRILSLILRLL